MEKLWHRESVVALEEKLDRLLNGTDTGRHLKDALFTAEQNGQGRLELQNVPELSELTKLIDKNSADFEASLLLLEWIKTQLDIPNRNSITCAAGVFEWPDYNDPKELS